MDIPEWIHAEMRIESDSITKYTQNGESFS